MLIRELVEILLEHRDHMVKVGCKQCLFDNSVYSMKHIEDKMIEIDKPIQSIYLE